MKRKNYLKMFIDYARKNDIWFSVYGNGDVDEITDTNTGNSFETETFDFDYKLGTQAAYEWLVKNHKGQ